MITIIRTNWSNGAVIRRLLDITEDQLVHWHGGADPEEAFPRLSKEDIDFIAYNGPFARPEE